MNRVVVVGGGWAGVAAAAAVRLAGGEVLLLERTDMLLGTGLVGGIIRNNGRYTATEEHIALGMGGLWRVIDGCRRHTGVRFPGHEHADLYDVSTIEPAVRRYLDHLGVELLTECRVTGAERTAGALTAVTAGDRRFEAAAFVETTGSFGPQGNCLRYGNGCAMCVMRCPTFGGRVSVAGVAGTAEQRAFRMDGSVGVMSGSCKLHKDSLAAGLRAELEEKGVAVVPLPPELRKGEDMLGAKACQQYALPAFADNLVLLDTGHAKLMSPYFPLAELRRVPGLENARYEDPYAGGVGNSIRYLSMAPHGDDLQVEGLGNLFVGGEKTGPLVGHTEAVVSGSLAGLNAWRRATGRPTVRLPETLAVGDALAQVGRVLRGGNLSRKLTFSGSWYFERMKELGLYTTNREDIGRRVAEAGLTDLFVDDAVADRAAGGQRATTTRT
ncbi:MAG: FAD-dependent oxidoreductase [Thermoleophilia bacterium]